MLINDAYKTELRVVFRFHEFLFFILIFKGELTESDDDENEVIQVAPEIKTRETSQQPNTTTNNKKEASGGEEKPEKENDDRKRSRRDDSNSSKSKKLKQELDADEEKKRVLKEKLRQLERQMQGDDDSDEVSPAPLLISRVFLIFYFFI